MILWRTTITFCIQIYKNLSNLKPEFMKDLFRLCATKRVQGEKHKFDLRISKSYQVLFGTKSLRIQGPKVWNSLPYHIKVT